MYDDAKAGQGSTHHPSQGLITTTCTMLHSFEFLCPRGVGTGFDIWEVAVRELELKLFYRSSSHRGSMNMHNSSLRKICIKRIIKPKSRVNKQLKKTLRSMTSCFYSYSKPDINVFWTHVLKSSYGYAKEWMLHTDVGRSVKVRCAHVMLRGWQKYNPNAPRSL